MRAGETAAALLYAGSAIATVLAGDWITFFVFWEAMAFSSLALIWQAGTGRARRAGMRFLLVHATGGALLFVGIALHLASGGDASLGALVSGSPPFWLILGAVAINAAIPPPPRLADRRLSGSLHFGLRVPFGLHHQDRGLRAAAPFPGNRDPGAAGRPDDALRESSSQSSRTTSGDCSPTTS